IDERFEISRQSPADAPIKVLDIVITDAEGTVTQSLTSIENLSIHARGGSDTIVVNDLEDSGLATFQVAFGREYTINGFRTITESVDGRNINREVPNAIELNDGARDEVIIMGTDVTDVFQL